MTGILILDYPGKKVLLVGPEADTVPLNPQPLCFTDLSLLAEMEHV